MAYMNQEKKAIISNLMKPILKKYKIKATLSVSNRSTIYLNVKSGSLDFIGQSEKDYLQVNPFWYHEHFEGEILDFLTEAHAALKSAGHYRNTDIQSDYFDEAYYYYIHIGQWDKPYQLTA